MTTAADVDHRRAISALLVICDELRVFEGPDVGAAARLATKVRADGMLPDDDARTAWRMLRRYRHRSDFPASPPLPPPAAPPPPPVVDRSTAGRPTGTPDGKARLLAEGRIGVKLRRFDDKDRMKTIVGWAWDKGRKEWTLPATPVAAVGLLDTFKQMVCTAGVTALAEIGWASQRGMLWTDPGTVVPEYDFDEWAVSGIPGAPLWEHQRRGLLTASDMHALVLGVPMGGGKSGTLVGAANRVEAQRVIIACPDKVIGVWPKQLRRHSPREWHVVTGKRRNRTGRLVSRSVSDRFEEAERALFDCHCGQPHAVCLNYELMWREPFLSWHPAGDDGDRWAVDAIIYDEGHRLTGTQASDTARSWAQWIKRRWLASGTPMPQEPLNVFNPFGALDSGIFGEIRNAFDSRYGEKGGYEGKQVVGLRDPEGLARKFFSFAYLPTVDLDLPPTSDVTIEVELEESTWELYRTLEKQAWVDVESAIVAAGGAMSAEGVERTMSPVNTAVLFMRCQQLTGGCVTTDDGDKHVVSTAKRDAVAESLFELGCRRGGIDGRSTPEPVVLFTRFVFDLDFMREIAEQLGVRYGEVSGRVNDLTDDSTMPDDVDLLGVQLQSGGAGVDLTRASIAGFYSMGYSLIDYLQARKRLDRPGQDRPVRFLHWIVPDTHDAEAYAALEARVDVIAALYALRGVDARALGLSIESVELGAVDEHGEIDPTKLGAFLPAEIAAYAPYAVVGSPASRATGRGSATRRARGLRDSVHINAAADSVATRPARKGREPGSVRYTDDDGQEHLISAEMLRELGLEGL